LNRSAHSGRMTLIPTRVRMPTAVARSRITTVGDLIESLGDIPLDRVRLDPPPGRATEADLLRLSAADGRLYELVDGTLVEKPMGWKEASLATWLARLFHPYLMENDIGDLVGADGTHRLWQGLIRLPDLAFVLWEHVPPDEELPQIPDLAPDLAVEILSPSNTPKEMARKRKEYFRAGTSLVWQVNPEKKTVEVFTSPTRSKLLGVSDTLDGGSLLPGFTLPLALLFASRGGKKRGSARRRKPKG
jgi:Uma2 family endonuclease